jgi:hypothetical protein
MEQSHVPKPAGHLLGPCFRFRLFAALSKNHEGLTGRSFPNYIPYRCNFCLGKVSVVIGVDFPRLPKYIAPF